ncbi:hypothetical protein TNCV_1640281 [Trichonephila clavipes]|nr:hypothetical protein TNCV_1640281 [Trichonephila clavipes]
MEVPGSGSIPPTSLGRQDAWEPRIIDTVVAMLLILGDPNLDATVLRSFFSSRRAASPHVRLVEGKGRWEASDHHRGFSLKLGLNQIVLSPAGYSKLMLTVGGMAKFRLKGNSTYWLCYGNSYLTVVRGASGVPNAVLVCLQSVSYNVKILQTVKRLVKKLKAVPF